MPNDYPFESDDGLWYFWLGDGLRGPFDDFNDAHARLTALTERADGQEKDS